MEYHSLNFNLPKVNFPECHWLNVDWQNVIFLNVIRRSVTLHKVSTWNEHNGANVDEANTDIVQFIFSVC